VKRLFIIAQWLAVGFIIISLIYFLVRKNPAPDHTPDNWSSWTGFQAISIEGVADSDNPRYVSAEKLDEFLQVLRERGYAAITTDDVTAYYYRDAPLPEKAVLILFEGGRKDHVVWATPRLIKNRMLGVLCVPTEVTTRWGNHFIDKADLRRIARHPNWRLASMGHAAVSKITVGPGNQTGNFLRQRIWEKQRYETDMTFEDRVNRDYRKAVELLSKADNQVVAAYLYPQGDPGEGADSDPLAASINRGALKQYHRIAFTQEGRPLNSYFADPYALSRMRVRGDWSGEDLIRHLEEWQPGIAGEFGGISNRWQLVNSRIRHDSDVLVSSRGSALLRGSDFWSDFEISSEVRAGTGTIGVIYLRFSGPHAYLRVTVQDNILRVQEKRLGKLQNLSSFVSTNRADQSKLVTIRLKNNRIWVTGDNEEIANAVPIARQYHQGHVWLSAEEGDVEFNQFTYVPHPPVYQIDGRYHLMTPAQRSRVSALIPFWIDAERVHPLSELRQVNVMRAAREGILTIPAITARKKLARAEARELAAQVVGVFNIPAVKMLVQQFAISGYQPEVSAAFRDFGMRTVFIMTAEEADAELLRGINIARDEQILITGEPDAVAEVVEKYQVRVPSQRMILALDETKKLPPGSIRAIHAETR